MNYLTGTILSVLLILVLSNCPQGCAECDPSFSVCFACKTELQANVFGQCRNKTIPNCIIYSPSDQCLNCQPTYKLEDNTCIKDYTGCVLSNSHDGSCFECGFSTVLAGSQCSGVLNCLTYSEQCTQCREGFQLLNNICIDKRAGCNKTRPQDGICAECQDDYKFVGYECISKNVSVPRCYIYNAEGKCQICKNGYNLFEHQCLLSFQIQAYVRAQIEGTADTFGWTKDGFVQGGKLEEENIEEENYDDDDIPMDENQQIQTIEHCMLIDREKGGCKVCAYGYYPAGEKCNMVSPLCAGHNVETGECLDCQSTLTLQNGACVDKNCQQPFTDGCLLCKQGWIVNQDLLCVLDDINCLEAYADRCDKCKPGYYVSASGTCRELPPNCAFANFQSGACLQCNQGYQINLTEGTCTLIPQIPNCKVINPTSENNCLICQYGWYPSSNTCRQVSPLCQDHNVQTGQCLSCKNTHLVVMNGKCIDGNCQTFDGDQCIACKPNHSYNEDKGLCEYADVNCERQAGQSCLVCKLGFYINLEQRCIMLPPNCESAFPNGYCSQCAEGYSMGADGKCLYALVIQNCLKVDQRKRKCLICDHRYYVREGECQRVSEGCDGYHPASGQCFTCKPNYTKQNSLCVESIPPPQVTPTNITNTTNTRDETPVMVDRHCRTVDGEVCIECSQRYYLNPQNKCVPVNPLCRDYNIRGECTQCYQGYTLSKHTCQILSSTDPNCQNFLNQACIMCYSGFYLNQQAICKRLNPLCKSSDLTNGLCTSCYPGYSLSQSGSCEIFFRDLNCKQFLDDTVDSVCVQCAPRYWLHSAGKCSLVNPLCNQFNNGTGDCVTCYPGYVQSAGSCVEGATRDPNCDVFEGDQCKTCYSGYYPQAGQCKQANPLCHTFNSSTGQCLTCYTGYILEAGNCTVGVPQDPHCKHPKNNKCEQCYQGYLPINGHCQAQNNLCKTVNPTNGHCQTCYPGYTIFQHTCIVQVEIAVEVAQATDIFCVRKSANGACIECSAGYYYDQDETICKYVDPLCKSYDNNNGRCTDCYDGYDLNNGECVIALAVQIPNCLTAVGDICTECLDNFYFSDGTCKMVSILCDDYDRSNGQCLSCIDGHALQEGECIYPALFDARCAWYENAFCSRCQDGYYVSNYLCQPVDRNCIYFNQSTRKCEECANGLQPSGLGCA